MSPPSGEGTREIKIPGDSVDVQGMKPGMGTYRWGGKVYSSVLGLISRKGGFVDIIPLAGKYVPMHGDDIIGTVTDTAQSNWLLDINSPYPGVLHTSESPWKVDFGATAKYLSVGDVITARVLSVDESKHVHLTMRDQGLKKLHGGHIVDIPYSKVPRVIGRAGSMIETLKKLSGCRILVGKNGRIWIDGNLENVLAVSRALQIIDRESHSFGLTDRVRAFLEDSISIER